MNSDRYEQITDRIITQFEQRVVPWKSPYLSKAEFDELENQLALRAACLGWSGDPMRQPLEVVAGIVRGILRKRGH